MLTQITVENFRGIKKTNFKGKAITLFVGQNRQGKTSVLRAIEWALGAKTSGSIINNHATGNDETRVRLETDKGLTLERILAKGAKKDRFSIHRPNGELVTDPQLLLNKVFNPMAFDPIRLIFMDAKTQASIVREALASSVSMTPVEAKQLGFDLDPQKNAKEQLEHWYKFFYDERTGINRLLKTMKEKASGTTLKEVPSDRTIEAAEKAVALTEAEYIEALKIGARAEAAEKNKIQREKLARMVDDLDTEILEGEALGNMSAEEFEQITDELQKHFDKNSKEESELRGAARQIEKTLEELGSTQFPTCPISKKIACTTDVSGLKEGIAKDLKASKVKLKKLFEENKCTLDTITNNRRRLELFKKIGTKKIERDRLQATVETLGVPELPQGHDSISLKKALDEMRESLSEMKAMKEVAKVGDLEGLAKSFKDLDDRTKAIKLFIDEELPKRMNLGLPDIRLENEGLYFKELLLTDECTSVQLRLASSLVRKLYPNSKIMTIDRLEVLDDATLLNFISRNSQDSNFQIFATYVGELPQAIKSLPNVQVIYMNKGEAHA